MVSAIYNGVMVQGLYSPINGHQYLPAGSKNGTYVRVYHMPSDITVNINLNKSSANPDITNGNKQYSLAGAIYGIYKTQADAQNNVNALAQITTDANGHGSASVKVSGDVTQLWYRELTAPTGYKLNPTSNAFGAGNGNTNPTINVTDDAARDPLNIMLTKKSEDDYADAPSLAGAQFTVKYYDGQYSSIDQLPAEATRTWVIETKEEDLNGKKIYRAFLSDDYLVAGSSPLYKDGSTSVVPVGTITVEETKVPNAKFTDSNGVDHDIYSLNNKTLNGTNEITQADGKVLMNIKYQQGSTSSSANMWAGNEVSNDYTINEKFNVTPYTVIKVDADTNEQTPQGNASLNGGSFEIINNNSYTINYNGTAVKPKEKVATFSLKDGEFKDGSKLPVGSYIVRELEAPEGYRLDGVIENTLEVTGTGTATVTLSDRVKKGGFKIQKQDIDTKTAEGDTDLTTVFRIINTGTNPFWVDSNGDGRVSADEMYANGAAINLPSSAVVKGTANGDGTFTSMVDGYFETVSNILPYSSYRIEEVTSPTGYKSDDGSITTTEFTVTEEGFMTDLTDTIKNKVMKGGFKIQKQDMDTGLRT